VSAATARALLNAGQLVAAERACEAALAQEDAFELRFLLGTARLRLGRHAAALAAFDRCVALAPGRAEARFARASALAALDRKAEAADDLQACLDALPDSAEVAVMLATLREELGDAEAAMTLYEHALRIDPACVPARLNRGALLLARQRPAEALREFEDLAAQSNLAVAHVNRAQALLALFRDEDAVSAADAALAIDPRHVLAACNRALALAALGRVADSEEAFRKARDIDPAQYARIVSDPAYGNWSESGPDPSSIAALRGIQRQQHCDWRARDDAVARVRALPAHETGAVLSARHLELAFDLLALPLTAAEQHAVACHIARAFPVRPRSSAPATSPTGRIRIGFLSPDFRPHPTAWLARLLLRKLDRSRFEVFAYALNPERGDPLRLEMLGEADRFIDMSRWSDAEAAGRIAADRIDVLVECGGYCDGARPGILALRPAAVQASYLGMPGTLGLSAIDYRISDAFCTPAAQQAHWTEKLVLLPETHLVYHPPEEVPAPRRSALGLPEDAFVYCCLSNPLKIEPGMFSAWMRILRATPGSVLWIYASKDLVRKNLSREAQAAGIDPARLRFAGAVRREVFVATAGNADLFLDTLHFGAHTTAMEVLWAGVPVLTCPGETMASRLAGSLMHAARIPELVVPDLDAYVDTAVRLAQTPRELAAIRDRLRDARTSAPIFDVPARVRGFEDAVRAMHARRVAGLAPDTLVSGRDF